MKPSEIFEGSESSLRKTYDEAVSPTHDEGNHIGEPCKFDCGVNFPHDHPDSNPKHPRMCLSPDEAVGWNSESWAVRIDEELDRRNITFAYDDTHKFVIRDIIRREIESFLLQERQGAEQKGFERGVNDARATLRTWLMNYDSKDGYSTFHDEIIEQMYDRLSALLDKSVISKQK